MAEHDSTAAISIRNRRAALYAPRLRSGQTVGLLEAPFLCLSVPAWHGDLKGAAELGAGGAVRFTATGGQPVTVIPAAEVFVWEMYPSVAA